jgi:hypothetical protein
MRESKHQKIYLINKSRYFIAANLADLQSIWEQILDNEMHTKNTKSIESVEVVGEITSEGEILFFVNHTSPPTPIEPLKTIEDFFEEEKKKKKDTPKNPWDEKYPWPKKYPPEDNYPPNPHPWPWYPPKKDWPYKPGFWYNEEQERNKYYMKRKDQK